MAPEVFDDAIGPELVAGLERAVLTRAEPGRPYPGGANRGGWKSGVDLFSWPDPSVGLLRSIVAAHLALFGGFAIGNAWAVVNRNGSWHGRHRHGVPIMGILFVASGDPSVPTVFETGPSVATHAVLVAERVEVMPEPGRLVLCGDLYHYVPVYRGVSPRIAIAFDGKIGA
jgi:hypothetical protein